MEEDLRAAIAKVTLPIELPATAFLKHGDKDRLVDTGAIISALPSEINSHIDMELTITNISANTFALPLNDGRYLFVKLKNNLIVGIEVVSRH
jgi:hypothetical protein